ncbi:MAG TPA: gluconate 2-dehydrogenase subunit 3 family protein [Chloroflexia bacterium]|nr:gluconate 2-dehydrogenase subunit 3 family protein [Chloroflexia bacterium]
MKPPLNVPAGGGVAGTPYPDFDVASDDKWNLDWDEKTRRLVLDRVRNVPPYRFFSPEEVAVLEALCARLMPQEDRSPQQRIPIAPWIDERLYKGEGDGYRYEDMPDDREAYRLGLQGFNQIAQALFDVPFVRLSLSQQEEVIRCVGLSEGSPPGAAWKGLPAARFFSALMRDVITNYYAHPAAWAEIGFSGPASPRGHIRLGLGKRDPWEAEEKHPRSSAEIVRRNLGKGQQESGEATH